MTAPRVLALVDQNERSQGCNLWRVWSPFAELQKRGMVAEWGWNQDDRTAMLAPRFDAVIMPRLTWDINQKDMARRWLTTLHARGQALIGEWDDDAFGDEIVERHVFFEEADRQEALDRREMARFAVDLADGVTVTTQHLADIVSRYTDKPVIVVPNSIDIPWWDGVFSGAAPRIVPSPTIGWAGGQRPDRDVIAMAEAWARIAKKRSDVTFVVIGYVPPAITDRVPQERLRWLAWLSAAEYPLNYVNVDIGCAPLSSEPFNRSKSNIKVLEYALAGAGVVASPTVYSSVIRNGLTGYLARTADEWEASLLDMLDSPNRRHRMAQNLRHLVERQHSLDVNLWRWPAAWQQIIDDAKERRSAEQRQLVIAR